MKVYIAGPITIGDQAQNVRKAIDAADELMRRGHVPFVPHLSWFWHFVGPKAWDDWIQYDLHWIEVCDCLLLLPGESRGAEKEVEFALERGIPVVHYIDGIDELRERGVKISELPRSPFHMALVEIAALHDAKQHDYGRDSDPFANIRASEEFGVPAWMGAVLRGNDKMSRLKTFAQKGVLKNESVEDSLMDLAVYALIALVLFRELKGSTEK